MKRIFAIALLAVVLLVMPSCGDGTAAQASSAAESSVSVEATSSASDIQEKQPVKIMPLGDAMTEGLLYGECGGYRVPLLKMLDEDKVPYEFVGLYSTGSRNITNGMIMHSGKGDATLFSVDKALPKMINLKPDVVLVMLGRAEHISGVSGEAFIEYFDKYVVSKVIKYFPDATVYVASIPPERAYAGPKRMNDDDSAQLVTNPLIKQLVETKKGEGANIEFVDMSAEATGLVWEDFDVDENSYPLPSGNEKLATVWHAAIKDKIAEISANINK